MASLQRCDRDRLDFKFARRCHAGAHWLWETKILRTIIAFAFALAAIATHASAQQPQSQRLSGTVDAIDGSTLVVKTLQGEVKVRLADKVTVFGVVKRTVEDIKPGQFLGVGAIPQPDGSQKAVRVNIFPPGESPNPGFRPWQGAPQGTMTNANVDSLVASVEGQVVILKYKDGEKKIIIGPQAQIVATVPGDKSELKPGAAIVIARAEKKPDASFEANRINVGRDGVVPQ